MKNFPTTNNTKMALWKIATDSIIQELPKTGKDWQKTERWNFYAA